MANKLLCPIMGEIIEDGICFDIHMVVEGLAPDNTIPAKVVENPRYKEICLSCPNHRED